jgi:hypothetical protein
MLRTLLWLPLAAALAGCVTTSSGTGSDAVRAEDQSTVLIHTSLHDAGCFGISMTLAQKDEQNRWVPRTNKPVVNLSILYGDTRAPSSVLLPPGEYGIVNFYCAAKKRAFAARIATKPTFWDRNIPLTYEKPIATFKVLPGEVVDIGSIKLPGGIGRDKDGNRKEVFIGVVTPTPEAALRALAEKSPDYYARRVIRPMVSAINI